MASGGSAGMVLDESDEVAPLQARLRALGEKLKAMARTFEMRRDPRAVCAYSLGEMQLRLADTLSNAESPPFKDPLWVVHLAESLHGQFIDACELFDATPDKTRLDHLPVPYQAVFRTICGRRKCTVLEYLVFPLAAHIAYDLPHALVATKFELKPERLEDFHAINLLLASSIQPIVQDVKTRYDPKVVPLVSWLDQLGGSFDELLTDAGFRLTRAMAWYEAIRLSDPVQHDAALAEIGEIPGRLIEQVQSPPISWPLRTFYRFTRYIVARMPLNWPTR
jgi:hypothetical protein